MQICFLVCQFFIILFTVILDLNKFFHFYIRENIIQKILCLKGSFPLWDQITICLHTLLFKYLIHYKCAWCMRWNKNIIYPYGWRTAPKDPNPWSLCYLIKKVSWQLWLIKGSWEEFIWIYIYINICCFEFILFTH